MRPSTRTIRRGLTLVELIIGTVMLMIIGSALASFTLAMSAGWKHSEQEFNAENASKRSGDQVESVLANMLYVAQSSPANGTATESFVFYWNKDGALATADRKAQLGEMALIQYDATKKAVQIYQPKTTGLTAHQRETLAADNWGDPSSPAIVAYFKSLDSVEVKPLVGGSSSGIEVTNANFQYFTPSGGKPMTSYQLRISHGTSQGNSFGSVPMRAGTKPKNFP